MKKPSAKRAISNTLLTFGVAEGNVCLTRDMSIIPEKHSDLSMSVRSTVRMNPNSVVALQESRIKLLNK